MTNEKLNVDRCWNASVPDVDDLGCHRWRALPYIEMTEHGPIAWHCCERCPARALHDPETEDGFEPEPVVVYPSSCFEQPGVLLYTNETGITCPACASPEVRQFDLPNPTRYRHTKSHVPGRTRCALAIGPIIAGAGCGCPATASGETVHHEGCAEFQATVESIARAEAPELQSIPGVESRRLEDGRVSLRRAPLPDIIVHPPTDPAPPSEELKQAMADEGFPWDEPPTLKRPTPVPAVPAP